uniref:RAB11-binding protein RELCH isoform X1 n=1 Tax=Ciona intestinalis TaxID=7719 RepID=UPI00089DCBA0|nr:RAB11-binding protein RELCH isoform X1 [Ciona intestinalis]|eukprot:XP_018668538.1 RAB11-binding protein RELCH isoform X1 [Ciona intestinalis]
MSNPFLDDSSESLETHNVETANEISIDDIAQALLKRNLILTALEFYTEIQEKGKDQTRLRNYFSNPSNFEQQITTKDSSGSERTASCSTFDSLDLARFSDDGAQIVDEKVAVLEFELRKAKDTIKSLRANLTQTAEQEAACLHNNVEKPTNGGTQTLGKSDTTDTIKPLELRAINHLVNEYLLNQGYRLSSITFADENDDQDFEDWHDVGLNTSKPPDLLHLYRDYDNHVIPKRTSCDVYTMTEEILDEDFTEEISLEKNEENTRIMESLQSDLLRLQEENTHLLAEIEKVKQECVKAVEEIETKQKVIPVTVDIVNPLVSSIPTTEEQHTLTNNNHEQMNYNQNSQYDASVTMDLSHTVPSQMPITFWEALVSKTQSNIEESWLKHEVMNICRTPSELVDLLSRCLPHIVPTVLLAKRDQLVPLLLGAASLHSDPSVRNQLLHLLFNLIKKPDPTQRQMILYGCKAYAKHVGVQRSEEELLPQFWEQIGHNFAERRQLVAEACGAIAPFLRPEMRGSLLMSILQQMQQEERLCDVRCSVVRSLAIINAFLDDEDKHKQSFQMLHKFLNDKEPDVVDATYSTYLPSYAMLAIHRGTLHTQLCTTLLDDLEACVSNQSPPSDCHREVTPLVLSISFLFAATLLQQQDVKDVQLSEVQDSRIPSFTQHLVEPSMIIGDKLNTLISSFDQQTTYGGGNDVITWIINQFCPRLLKILQMMTTVNMEIVCSLTNLTQTFCSLFGSNFTNNVVKPKFEKVMEEDITTLNTALLPAYAAGVILPDAKEELNEFLLNSTISLSQAKLSLCGMQVALTLLRSMPANHDVIMQVLWSSVMHESAEVRESAASLLAVMTSSEIETRVLSTRVVPALITLSTDTDVNVRIATIHAFSSIVELPSAPLELIERVIVQMTELVSANVESDLASMDGTLLGMHKVRMLIVSSSTKVAATAHPKFRDEFILPHLVAIAASNNQHTDSSKRSEIATLLLEAYTTLSCCFIASNLLQGSFLPGLKCLLTDMEALHKDRTGVVSSLISEVEQKLERGSVTSDTSPQLTHRTSIGNPLSGAVHLSQAVTIGAEDARKKILNTWGQLKAKGPPSPVFHWKK